MCKMPSMAGAALALVLVAGMGSGCGGGDEEKCTRQSCSGHGSCDDSSGQVVCTCEQGYGGGDCSSCASGYQDNDSNGTCRPDCASAGLECGAHGQCDDSGGLAECTCQEAYSGDECQACADGYQDYDRDGTCLPRCENSGLDCHHGRCEDAGGEAQCLCDEGYAGAECDGCASGYQDNDDNGTCLPSCDNSGLVCGPRGRCDDSGGEAECICDTGYAGTECGTCAQGYQDNDNNGTCLEDCLTADVNCNGHGACDDSSGQAVCACQLAYTGPECTQCNTGYQDNDDDEICLKDCHNARLDCSIYGHCEDITGEAICVCDVGYAGDLCDRCASGYQDNDGNGTCREDCSTADLGCLHGQCQDSSGAAQCVCETGYAGDTCGECAPGYQDNDDDDVCEIGCALWNGDCGLYGTCDDTDGTPHCACYPGYTGSDCRQCDDGYQDNDGNGTCHEDCATAAPDCVHGSCSDVSGEALCVCEDTWDGDLCDACAAGYQDNDGNETCEPNCASAGLTCAGHGHCDDSGGTALCVCDEGYTGADCSTCDDGYQDSNSDGVCRPDCATLGYDVTCAEGGHGYCDYSDNGEAVCICDNGWSDDGQGHCSSATGFDCSAPLPLPVANAVYENTTVGAGDDYDPGCTSYSNAEDVVYVIDVAVAAHVKFTSEGFDTVMYLRSSCDDAQTELACDDDSGPGRGSMLEWDFQPGTYYLFVDGYGQYNGNYTLTVEVSCAAGQVWDPGSNQCVDDPCDPNPCEVEHQTVCEVQLPGYVCHCDPGYIDDPNNPGTCIPDPNPHGESCADAMPLEVLESGSVTGTTGDAADDGAGTCGGNGPDRVYTFTLNEQMRAEFAMGGYDTVLHLRTVCDDQGSQVSCDDDGGAGTNSLLGPLVLDPGTYYLWADSYSGGGDYTLDYGFRVNPCADDEAVCPGTPVCEPSSDWSSFQCVCPEGTLPYGNDCIDDPCDPNPCQEPNRNVCTPDLPGAYLCDCNPGYIDDPNNPGTCMEDPDANEWAFIVYLNADNNLDPAGWDDLGEMETAGSTAYVHIVVLFDSAGYSDDGHARKLYITQGGYDVIEDMGEIDMGDWQTLRDFGIWAIQNYPARHHALVMWDHGSGWDRNKPKPLPYKGMSWDDSSGNHISIAAGEYEQALQGITAALGGKLDIVGHDECLMGRWEVALVSAPYAHYFVASEETEPGDGWAYDGFLPGLVADPLNTSPLDLATSIVDTYYASGSSASTLSAIDLDTFDQLNATMNAFADALRAHPDLNGQINTVRGATQSFYYPEYRDLKHFALGIMGMSGAPADMVSAAQALSDQLDVTIAHNQAQSGYAGAYGMSVYLPQSGSVIDNDYLNAAWSQVSTWDEFLQGFTTYK